MASTGRRGLGLQAQQHTGDCPACPDGRIQWQRFSGPDDPPALYAGACEQCGQWAAQCPGCGDRIRLEHDIVECPCETCLVLLPQQSTPSRIESITAHTGNEVRRTYALPEK